MKALTDADVAPIVPSLDNIIRYVREHVTPAQHYDFAVFIVDRINDGIVHHDYAPPCYNTVQEPVKTHEEPKLGKAQRQVVQWVYDNDGTTAKVAYYNESFEVIDSVKVSHLRYPDEILTYIDQHLPKEITYVHGNPLHNTLRQSALRNIH